MFTGFQGRSFATYVPYVWMWDSKAILYQHDHEGDENLHTFVLDLESANIRDLTPWHGVRSELIAADPKFPEQILVGMNLRDRRFMDAYRIDIRTGAAELDTEDSGDVETWMADADLIIRAALVVTTDAGTEIRVRDDAKQPWRTLISVSAREVVLMLDFSADGRSVYLKTSLGTDKVRVVAHEIVTGRDTVIAGDEIVDVTGVMIHPTRRVVESVTFFPDRKHRLIIDPAVADDFADIDRLGDGVAYLVSRDFDDHKWLVGLASDHHPIRYYLWNRVERNATFLFSAHPKLEEFILAPMYPITFAARDGMEMRG
ncbi:MAG: S9 family peptidase, partial [Candidatus Binataceae bacterium]